MVQNPKFGPSYRYKTPVVLLKGVKNSHFSDGHFSKYDLPSYLSTDTAQSLIAVVIKDFLAANKLNNNNDINTLDSQEALEYLHDNTSSILEPFKFSTKNYESICRTGQGSLMNAVRVANSYVRQTSIRNLHYFPTKYTIDSNSNLGTIVSGYYAEPNSNWADISIGPFFGNRVVCNFIVPLAKQNENNDKETIVMSKKERKKLAVKTAEQRLTEVCSELNSYALSAGRSIATKQQVWPISNQSPAILEIGKFSDRWEFEKEDIFSQKSSTIKPHYFFKPTPLKLGGNLFFQASCSVVSIASVVEWYTINSHVIRQMRMR